MSKTFAIGLALFSFGALPSNAGDVVGYGYYKGHRYQLQRPDQPPFQDANGVYPAEAWVNGTSVITANVTTSTRSKTLRSPIPSTAPFLLAGLSEYLASQNSPPELDSLVGTGPVDFSIETTHDGTETATLNVGSEALYPTLPSVEVPAGFNYWDDQALRWKAPRIQSSKQDLQLKWGEWVNPTDKDFIQIAALVFIGVDPTNLLKTIFLTPEYGQPGAIPPTATSYTIPAGTLPSNSRMYLYLRFVHVVDINTSAIPDARGIAAFYTQLKMEIRTDTSWFGEPEPDGRPPRLTSVITHPEFSPSGVPKVRVEFSFSESLPIENSGHSATFTAQGQQIPSVETDNSNGYERFTLVYTVTGATYGTQVNWRLSGVTDWAGNPLPEQDSSGSFTLPDDPYAPLRFAWSSSPPRNGYANVKLSVPLIDRPVIIETSTDLKTWTPLSSHDVSGGQVSLDLDPAKLPAVYLRARY